MVKYIIVTLSFLIIVSYSNDILAQEKYEKESRIKQSDVPPNAFKFIDSLSLKNKVKWYLEEGIERKSVEAKFIRNGKRHSVEFDTLGTIEDVEIEMEWEDIQASTKNSISTSLKEDCEKYKIIKTQIQYTGNQSSLLLKLLSGQPTEILTVKYEIKVRCRSKKNTDLFEYLFTDKGQLILASRILFKSSNHLEY